MNKNDDDSKLIGRRRTLALLGAGLGAGSLFVLGACNKDKGGGPAGSNSGSSSGGGALDCYSPVDDASKATRRTLQYKAEAVDPVKHCSACAQFNAGQYGDCGGCKLFSGPVKPNGGCLSWAPKNGEAGAVPN